MKYKDILQFEPITETVQFDLLSNHDYQLDIVRNFVFPDYFLDTILPEMVKNMVFGGRDQRGVQIIGSYGTGKSHLMGLVQLIAEYPEYLNEIRNERAREILAPIAGKFKVHRFEIQQQNSLWKLITYQLQRFLDENGVDYHFDPDSLKMYHEQLSEMMATFEEKYPDKGFILAIDEMLHYLESRVESGNLPQELIVLQALGQACNSSKFFFMFGVQEIIYSSRKFQFAAQALRQVKDRYRDLTIRKEDVAYVVQKRLLVKTEQQKQIIREHLSKFSKYFANMHGNLDAYVNLFPVHPSYLDNFQKIKLAQSQREVLKTLSRQFDKIKDEEIPTDAPGLITYDMYFEQMMSDPSMQTIPDFKVVSDTVSLIHDKIENNFENARRRQIPLAKRIANACAIKLIQADLGQHHGATPETLTDDLCCTFPLMESHEFLVEQVGSCANLIKRATSGQFFDIKDNGEYYVRTEGGINIDQMIQDEAEINMTPALKDKAFYKFMVENFGIDSNPYRTGFDIYQHDLVWNTHRITRDGYIFFGGPNEKSTTTPRQHFYMIFMPIFRIDNVVRNNEHDEVYFVFDGLSEEFKQNVVLYGAACNLYNTAPSEQKQNFRAKMETLFTRTSRSFAECYLNGTKVYFNGDEPKTLVSFSLPGQGSSVMEIFDFVASTVLERSFTEATPYYPAFTTVRATITNDNRDRYIKNAIAKVVKPTEQNIDGEAILRGLNLIEAGQLNAEDCSYAVSIIDRLEEKGDGKVLNRDEILSFVPFSENIWRSTDFQIEADFEFVVIAAMVQLGLLEIKLSDGRVVNASNIEILRNNFPTTEYYSFALVKKPQGINIPLIRKITKSFMGQDLSNKLEGPASNQTFNTITTTARELATEIATFIGRSLSSLNEVTFAGKPAFNDALISSLRIQLPAARNFFDKLTTYTSLAKLRNLQIPTDYINTVEAALHDMRSVSSLMVIIRRLETQISYLTNAKQFVPANSELMSEIDRVIAAVDRLPVDAPDSEIENYEASLRDTKQRYIDFYLQRYNAVCLNEIDNQKRTALMNSPAYQVCQVLRECSILNPAVLDAWMSDFRKLRIRDNTIETQLQNYPSPIATFNPLTSGANGKNIVELTAELDDIYRMWQHAIVDYLNSDSAKHTLSLMKESDRQFANSIINFGQFDDANSARSIVQFIQHVNQDLDEVHITSDILNEFFNRALTRDELYAQFDRLVAKLMRGKEPDKVRFLLRNSDNNG